VVVLLHVSAFFGRLRGSTRLLIRVHPCRWPRKIEICSRTTTCMYIIVRRTSVSIQCTARCARSTIDTWYDEAALFCYRQDCNCSCIHKLLTKLADNLTVSPDISCFSYNSMVHCRHLTAIPTSEWSAVVCKQSTLCKPADPFCCCHREIARRLNCITETFLLIILSFLLFFLFILLFLLLLLLSNRYNVVCTLASSKSSSVPNGLSPLPACFLFVLYFSPLQLHLSIFYAVFLFSLFLPL